MDIKPLEKRAILTDVIKTVFHLGHDPVSRDTKNEDADTLCIFVVCDEFRLTLHKKLVTAKHNRPVWSVEIIESFDDPDPQSDIKIAHTSENFNEALRKLVAVIALSRLDAVLEDRQWKKGLSEELRDYLDKNERPMASLDAALKNLKKKSEVPNYHDLVGELQALIQATADEYMVYELLK
jgi:hypothetical protein